MEEDSRKILAEVGVVRLREDLQRTTAVPEAQSHEVPRSIWPESVKRFSPVALQHHGEGVLLVLARSGRSQEGLLVMIDPKADPGTGGSGVGYKPLGEGIFWCWEKMRIPYRTSP